MTRLGVTMALCLTTLVSGISGSGTTMQDVGNHHGTSSFTKLAVASAGDEGAHLLGDQQHKGKKDPALATDGEHAFLNGFALGVAHCQGLARGECKTVEKNKAAKKGSSQKSAGSTCGAGYYSIFKFGRYQCKMKQETLDAANGGKGWVIANGDFSECASEGGLAQCALCDHERGALPCSLITDAPVGKVAQMPSVIASDCPATNWWSLGFSVIVGKCHSYIDEKGHGFRSTKMFPGLWSSQLNRTTRDTTKFVPVVITKGFVDHPFPMGPTSGLVGNKRVVLHYVYNNETAKYEQVGDVSKRSYCISNCMVPSSELPSKSKSSRAGKVVTLSTYKKSTGNRKYMSGHYSANKKMRTAFSSIYKKTQKELMVFVKHCIEHKVRGALFPNGTVKDANKCVNSKDLEGYEIATSIQ